MKLGIKNVDFLRLNIRNGSIISQGHIAQKIREFLDEF